MNTLDSIGLCPLEKLNKCNEQGCCIGLDQMRKRVIFKGERLVYHASGEEKKARDCFIFTMNKVLVISPVELKSKAPNISSMQEKFQNAVDAVELFLKK